VTGKSPLRIGLSACFFHADPKRPIFKGKTLQYLEQSLARWVMSEGALVYLIPSPGDESPVKLRQFAADLDGLVLQGGSDVAPESYGEAPLKPEWGGDRVRDLYEMALYREFVSAGKPVLGVCRGLQLINVACGGSLFQDVTTQVPEALVHRDWEIYDQIFHAIACEPGSVLESLGHRSFKVNTVHHQAVKNLGKGLVAEARCADDGVIEALRATGDPWVYAVQWHPEFQDPRDPALFDTKVILKEFLGQAKKRR
jgi:putative glutamine amidotransferase